MSTSDLSFCTSPIKHSSGAWILRRLILITSHKGKGKDPRKRSTTSLDGEGVDDCLC